MEFCVVGWEDVFVLHYRVVEVVSEFVVDEKFARVPAVDTCDLGHDRIY